MSVIQEVLLFSGAVGVVVGAFGLLVAVREHKSGASWWAWIAPGTFGVLLLAMSFLKFLGAA